MNAVWQFEDSALDQALTAVAMIPVQVIIGGGMLISQVAKFIATIAVWMFAAATENAGLIAKLVGIVAVTVVVASTWQIGVGVMIVVALTVVMKRKGKI